MGVMERPGPDWFTGGYAEAAFYRHLMPMAGQPLQCLQIGAYCGDASVWLLDNVLTASGAWLVDVDTWVGSHEVGHQTIDFGAVNQFYVERMKHYPRVGKFTGTSDDYFEMKPAPFDFIYVDGSHESAQVLRDAVNADRYLRVGGLLAFDDYLWWEYGNERNTPRPAIDAFLRCFELSYSVLEIGTQVWVRKVR